MKYKLNLLTLILLNILIFNEVNCQYILKRSVFGNGGNSVSNESYNINSTIGQNLIGIISNSDYTNKLGFRYTPLANGPTFASQIINLNQGWNLISTYITAPDMQVQSIMSQLGSDFLIVKDYLGNVYWPDWGIDDIGTWDIRQGYQIYMNISRTMTMTGVINDPQLTPINYTPGWKIAAYLRTSPMDPATATASLGASLLIMKDGDGNVYWPDWGIDDIILMRPGQGYQMYISEPATLLYPAN